MANIGLVAVDSHHYPNLPLGKIKDLRENRQEVIYGEM